MSSVDTRIVVLQFDNHDFEQRVNTSVESLDKLNKSLKLDESGKSLDNLSAKAKSFDMSSIGDAADAVSHKFSLFGTIGDQVLRRLTDSALNLGKNLLFAIPNQIKSGGMKRALNLEHAQFQIEGLNAKWEDIKDDINYAVEGTPFGLDEAAVAASQLLASGVEFGKVFGPTGNSPMAKALRGISGVATMTGAEYPEISRIFAAIAGNGRLMGQQLTQLGMRGLPAAAKMAEFFNQVRSGAVKASDSVTAFINEVSDGIETVTEANIREWVSAKDITVGFDVFSEAMDSAFGEHAKEANKTYAGSLDNVKAALSRLGASSTSDKLKTMRNLFNVLIPVINAVHTALKPLITVFEGVRKWATDNLISRLIPFIEKMQGLNKWSATATAKWRSFFGLDNADKDLEGINERIKNILNGTKSTTKEEEKAADAAEKVTETVVGTKKAYASLDELANAVIRGDYGIYWDRYNALEAEGYAWQVVQNRVNELLGCQKRHAHTNEDVERTMAALAKTTITTTEATEAQGDATKITSKRLDEMSERGRKVYSALGRYFGKSEDEIRKMADAGEISLKALDNAMNGSSRITEEMAARIENSGRDVWDSLSKYLGLSVDEVKALASAGEITTKTMSEAFAYMDKQAEKAAARAKVWQDVKDIFSGIVSVGKILVKGVIAVAKGVWPLVKEIGGLLKDIGLLILDGFGFLGRWITGVKEAADATDVWTRITEGLRKVLTPVVNVVRWLRDGVQHLVENIKTLWGKLKEMEGIKRLREELGYIKDILKDAFGKLWKNIKGATDDAGTALGKLKGHLPTLDDVANFIGMIAGKVAEFIHNVRTGEGKVGKFFNGIKTFFGTAAGGIKRFFQWFVDHKDDIVNFFKNLKNTKFGQIFGRVKDWIVNDTKEFFDKLDFKTITDKVKAFFKKVGDALSTIDWAKVFDFVSNILKMLLMWKLIKAIIENLKSSSSMMSSIGGFFNALTDRVKGKQPKVKVFQTIAISILLLAGAMFIVASIPADRLIPAGIAIVGLFTLLLVAAGIMSKIAKGVDWKGALGLSTMFFSIGVSMLMLAGAVAIFGHMNPETIEKGGIAVAGMLMAVSLAARVAGRNGGGIFALALGLLLLAPAIGIYSRMKLRTLEKGGAAIAGMIIAIGLATRVAGGKKAAGTVIAFALAIDLMAIAVGALSRIDTKPLITAGAVIAGLLLALAGATRLSVSYVKAKSAILTIAVMVAPIIAIATALYFLGHMDTNALLKAAVSIGIVLGSVMASLLVLNKAGGDNLKKTYGNVGALLLVVVGIGAVFIAMSQLGVDENMLAIAVGMSAVILAVSESIAILSKVDFLRAIGAAIEGVAAMFILLVGAEGILALMGVIADIGNGKGLEKIQAGAEALKVIGQGIGDFIGGIINGIIGGTMEGISSGLERFGTALANFTPNFQLFMDAASKLDQSKLDAIQRVASALLILTAADLVHQIADWLTFGNNSMTLMGEDLKNFADPLTEFCTKMSEIDPASIDSATHALESLGVFMAAIPREGGAVGGLLGNVDLEGFGDKLIAFAPKFKEYAGAIEGVSLTDVYSGNAAVANTLKAFSQDISARSGGLLQKIMGEVDLGVFGDQLEKFGGHFVEYYNAVKDIKEDELKGSSAAASTIMAFAQEVPNEGGWLAKIIGDNTLDKFGPQLASFGLDFKLYYDRVKDIKEEELAGSSAAASTIMKFANAVPNSGDSFLKGLVGDNTLDEFGKQLMNFGWGFRMYWNRVKDITETDLAGSSAAVNTILEFAKLVPNSGTSVVKALVGDNTLDEFGKQLMYFGYYFAAYYDAIKNISPSKVESSATAAEALGRVANAIGGKDVMDYLLGETKPLTSLGKDLSGFGGNFAAYSDSIKDMDFDKVSRSFVQAKNALDFVNAAAGAEKIVNFVTALINLSNADYGIAAFGDNINSFAEDAAAFTESMSGASIESFNLADQITRLLVNMVTSLDATSSKGGSLYTLGDGLEYFGPKLNTYAGYISEVDTSKMSQVTVQIKGVIAAVNEAAGLTGATTFGDNMAYFGEKFYTYYEYSGRIDKAKFDKAIEAAYDMIALMKSMKTIRSTDTSGFSGALNSLANTGLTGFTNAFSGAAAQAKLSVAINSMITYIVTLARNQARVGSAIYMGFFEVGRYGSLGLEAGLKSRISMVQEAGRIVGNAAIRGARLGMAEKSPSRLMEEAGEFADEGLIIGLLALMGAVHSTAEKVGENTVDAMASPLSTLSDIISGEIDMDPTIRPVLDLSDIQNKSGLINGMIPNGGTYNLSGGTAYAMAGANSRFNTPMSDEDLAAMIATQVSAAMTQAVSDIQESNEKATYVINVPLYMDGRETAHVTAPFMRSELDRIDRNNLRKAGTR